MPEDDLRKRKIMIVDDEEDVRVFLNTLFDDNDYETTTEITITLESEQAAEVDQNFTVTRIDSTSFETTVTGRCLDRSGTAPDIVDTPARGVEVVCTYTDDDGAHTLYDQTDVNGEYSFFVQWTDAESRDFVDGTPDSTIPKGEDGLVVEIAFDAPFDGESFTGADNRLVKSWLDPNYVPDAIHVVP